jgi:hypothetical protein
MSLIVVVVVVVWFVLEKSPMVERQALLPVDQRHQRDKRTGPQAIR